MPDKNKQGRIFLLDRAKAQQTGTIWLSVFQEEKTVRDLVSGTNLTNPGGFSIDEGGSVATFNGAQQQNIAFVVPVLNNTIIAARVKATAAQAANPGAAFGIYASSGVQSGFGVGFDTANSVGCTYIDNSAAGTLARSAGSLNNWYTVFVQHLDNRSTYAWINGKPATTGQGSAHSSTFSTINEISIGAQHRSSGFLRQFKGNIEWAAILNLPVGANNVLTDDYAEYLYESNYPYSLEAKPSRIFSAGTSSGSTGTVAVTNANDTSSASGATTVTGSVAKSNANDTSVASGTTTILGTSATTNATDTSSASGTTTVTGTLATTNANDTVSASGAVGNNVTGTSSTTNANDTSSASGTTTVKGTVAAANVNDTSTASGTTTVKGTSATTNANDTATANGVAGIISGTVAYINANDTVTASGIAGTISGTVAYTNANDIATASGTTPETNRYSGGYEQEYTKGHPWIYPISRPRIEDIIPEAEPDLVEAIIAAVDVAENKVDAGKKNISSPIGSLEKEFAVAEKELKKYLKSQKQAWAEEYAAVIKAETEWRQARQQAWQQQIIEEDQLLILLLAA